MVFAVDFGKTFCIDMCVDLCCADVGVAEHFLYCADVGASLEEV